MKRVLAILVVLVLSAIVSCQEHTQIVVEARTNVAYKPGIITSFTVGSPGQTERAEPTTETSEPWDGSVVGTLVVVPGTADDAALSVKLVMGVVRNARDCTAPDYRGCIVARRRLRYSPHEKLRLPITLFAQCVDVPCDELSTCSALGQCVPVEPQCGDGSCALPGEGDVDGGVVAGDASNDVGNDSASTGDASSDAVSTDASGADASATTNDSVACTNGGPCPLATQVCCFSSQSNTGSCVDKDASCTSGGGLFRFACDDHADCGAGKICCIGPTGGFCADPTSQACPYSWACGGGSDLECPPPQKCTGKFGNEYRHCQTP